MLANIAKICLTSALLIGGVLTSQVQAEPIFIGGVGIMSTHPTLGDEGIRIPGPPGFAIEPSLSFTTSMDLRLDLTSYTVATDPLILEDATFTFATGNIVLSFGPATFTPVPPPSGIIGSGEIHAVITGATTTIPFTSVSQFIGGPFQMTFTGAKITPGTGASGGGSVQFDLVPTASFTISTPEPAAFVLSGMALLGFVGMARRIGRR